MTTLSQWINLFIMSPERDSDSIEALIEEMMDSEKFHGMTTDDLFDTAHLSPIKHT